MNKIELIIFIVFSVLIIAGIICLTIGFWLMLADQPIIAFGMAGSILLIIGVGGNMIAEEIIDRAKTERKEPCEGNDINES